MKIVLAPDSFKGSLSAPEVCAALSRGVRRVQPQAEMVSLPVADGGEGTLDAMVAATSGQRVLRRVWGPLGESVEAAYGLLGQDGQIAVVETAQAAGLNLVPAERRDPRQTTTYGVGELLRAAAQSGAAQIIVGLGGSATNDGGAGALQALGVRFLDRQGKPIPAGLSGGALRQVASIDASPLAFPLGSVIVTIASDVTNPLLGPSGASEVFGPQKGADATAVAELGANLSHFAGLLERDLGVAVGDRPGAGAAGGLGAGLMALLGAEVRSGIGLVLDAIHFEGQAAGADWVFTGEGSIDAQTLEGKAVAGVLARCVALGIPAIAFGGSVDAPAAAALAARGLRAAFPIVSGPMTVETAMREAAALLENTAERVMRLIVPPA